MRVFGEGGQCAGDTTLELIVDNSANTCLFQPVGTLLLATVTGTNGACPELDVTAMLCNAPAPTMVRVSSTASYDYRVDVHTPPSPSFQANIVVDDDDATFSALRTIQYGSCTGVLPLFEPVNWSSLSHVTVH